MVRSAAIVAMVLALGACERGQVVARSGPAPAPAPAHQTPAARSQALLAAAEPFETAATTAFSASQRQLDRTIARADAAAGQVRGAMGKEAPRLDGHVAALREARDHGDRSGVALAAVEGYRTLVTAAPAPPTFRSLSLMDYAGFRYVADLKSRPIRWGDMREAAAFAADQWAEIEGRVGDRALRARGQTAIVDMAEAARERDAELAAEASRAQADVVDELERRFGGVR